MTVAAISANAVTGPAIAANSIASTHLSQNSVTAPAIATGAVGPSQLSTGAVTSGKIANAAVDTAQLVNASVTGVKIASNTVTGGTGGNLASGTITSVNLASSSVTSTALAAAAVTGPAIASGAITGTAPVSVTSAPGAGPAISISQATGTTDGYLSLGDWNLFHGKQDRVTGTCGAGKYVQIVNPDGTVSCGTDANNVYTAGSGLSLSPTLQFSANFTPAGVANNGFATTIARGDHLHAIFVPVGLGDFAGDGGAPTLTRVQYASQPGSIMVPGWNLPPPSPAAGGSCIIASSLIPRDALGGATMIIDLHGPDNGQIGVSTSSTGVGVGVSPTCLNLGGTQGLTIGKPNSMLRMQTFPSQIICGPNVSAGPLDILVLRICNAGPGIGFTVTDVHLLWN